MHIETSDNGLHMFVELQDSNLVKELKDKVDELTAQNSSLIRRIYETECMYGNEVMINSELIDLCKSHDIRFHERLDHVYRITHK